MSPVAIVGAGSWGTALAFLLAHKGLAVRLWNRTASVLEGIAKTRHNPRYLSDVELPPAVEPITQLAQALEGAEFVVLAVAAEGVREVCRVARRELAESSATLISATKGLEPQRAMLISEVLAEELGEQVRERLVVLSGPNLAAEICAGIPTATVVASPSRERALAAQELFACPTFRVYTNPDPLGVELGGALKNIIAIGAGINDGLGFGDNSKATLITRGLAEMTRLGVARGARAETFRGLSGLGDLAATCASKKSRNWRLGYAVARGRTVGQALEEMAMVAEGVPTTRAALRLAAKHKVEMPITRAVHAVLFEGLAPRDAVAALMTRDPRDEAEGL